MVWILIALPLVTLVMVLVLAFTRAPSPHKREDPPALRTIALITCVDQDTPEMLDVLEVALRRAGHVDVATGYDRDGYNVVATHEASGTKRWLLPVVIAPSMQLFTGAQHDDPETRAYLRALHEALRADARVKSLRWIKRELHNQIPDRSETAPFDGF